MQTLFKAIIWIVISLWLLTLFLSFKYLNYILLYNGYILLLLQFQDFPEEYEEYKLKRDKEMKLKRETELITFKNNAEKKLQQEKEEFERNILKEKNLKDVTRIHFYSDSMPENKRRKTEISLGRDFSSNHSWLIIQIILILVLLVTFVGSPVYLLIIGNGLLVAVYLLDQNGHWKICCVVYYTGFVFLYFVLYVTSSDAQQKELPSTSPLNWQQWIFSWWNTVTIILFNWVTLITLLINNVLMCKQVNVLETCLEGWSNNFLDGFVLIKKKKNKVDNPDCKRTVWF